MSTNQVSFPILEQTTESKNQIPQTQPREQDSLQFLRSFIKKEKNKPLDVTGVFSEACYKAWDLRQGATKLGDKPEESFYHIVVSHIRGTDGKSPFIEEEETALLKEIRKKQIWACFQSVGGCNLGAEGFPCPGFNETFKTAKLAPYVDPSTTETEGQDNKGTESAVDCRFVQDDTKPTRYLSSYEVFSYFSPVGRDGKSGVLSRECFEMWVSTRRNGVKRAEHSFRKALIAHLSGKDGRRPFPENIEKIVLREIRKKETWPCFRHRKEPQVVNIGKKGFRHLGYHETKRNATIKAKQGACLPAEVLQGPHPGLLGDMSLPLLLRLAQDQNLINALGLQGQSAHPTVLGKRPAEVAPLGDIRADSELKANPDEIASILASLSKKQKQSPALDS